MQCWNAGVALVPTLEKRSRTHVIRRYYGDVIFEQRFGEREPRGYKNSERFQLLLARRYHIPVRAVETELAVFDYYHWLPDLSGAKGCFPKNYAGVAP